MSWALARGAAFTALVLTPCQQHQILSWTKEPVVLTQNFSQTLTGGIIG